MFFYKLRLFVFLKVYQSNVPLPLSTKPSISSTNVLQITCSTHRKLSLGVCLGCVLCDFV